MKDNIFALRDLGNYSSITEMIKNQNVTIENKVLEQDIIEANYYISKQLNVPLATKLFYLKKCRVVEGVTRSIEKVYIPYNEVEGMENMDFNNTSFYAKLHEYKGISRLTSSEEILIVKAKKEECDLLGLEQDEEILLIKGITYKENDDPLEYFEISSDPMFYRFRSVSVL